MSRLKNGTICSKHEEIADLAEKIQDLAAKCLEDGQNMERGLDEKRKRIDVLESENESLKEELDLAEKRVAELEAELEAARQVTA